MKERPVLGLGENARNQPADDRTRDTHQTGGNKTHVLIPRHERTSDQSDDETDKYGPDYMEHGVSFP